MAHSHSLAGRPGADGDTSLIDPAELRRHRRALRILIVVLIPLAVWTGVGLVAFWPSDISSHVNADVAGYSVAGVTYPTAEITAVNEISCEGLAGSTPGVQDTRCANIDARLTDGVDQGQAVSVPLTNAVYSSGAEVGQKVKLIRVPALDGQPAAYQFSDFERRTPLLLIALLFAVVVVAVARWRGFASLVGLGFAGFILVKFMFPALVAGSNPIMIGLIGSSAIMFVVLYAAHGFSARTTTALVGTLFGLILISGLGYGATRWAHLTGVASEEDYVLSAAAPDLKLTSVVVCGIIVAGLGVLNDVTITQASAVWELADHHGPGVRRQSRRVLFSRAMRIGRDHIASTVYTIAFATAGASLSVLLLLAVYNRPLFQVLQTEQFSGEIIRTLVGSIGLVLAVPLTTAIGVAVVRASHRAGATETAGGRRPGKGDGVSPAVRGRSVKDTQPSSTEQAGAGTVATETVGAEQAGAGTVPAESVAAQKDGSAPGSKEKRPRTDTSAKVPAPTDAAAKAAGPARKPVRRVRRPRAVDDFGDFSDLRDPDESPSDRRPR